MAREARTAGWALLAHGVLTITSVILIGYFVGALGATDLDDPSVGLRFLQEHRRWFVLNGLVLVATAVALAVAVLALDELLRDLPARIWRRLVLAVGLLGAACLSVAGIFAVAAPGPLEHIAGFGQSDARAAYLVVQMAGTQVALPLALLATAAWVGAVGPTGRWAGTWGPVLGWLALVPALRVPVGLVGALLVTDDPAGEGSSVLWVLYQLAVVSGAVWFVAAGVKLLRRRSRLASPQQSTS